MPRFRKLVPASLACDASVDAQDALAESCHFLSPGRRFEPLFGRSLVSSWRSNTLFLHHWNKTSEVTLHEPTLASLIVCKNLGRSANVAASMPYGYGHFEGRVFESQTRVSRSGLADARIRIAVNLRGGRAVGLRDFLKYRERTVIGASLTTVIPIGQHDPARLINPGTNRWAFKPEIGISRRRGSCYRLILITHRKKKL